MCARKRRGDWPRLASEPRSGSKYATLALTLRSAHHDVERRPRRAQSQSAEECASCSLPIRELVIPIPAPCGDHGQNQASALSQQVFISAGIALAHIFGDMGEVEFDGSAAARLEIDEQQSGLRAEHVARVRLAVQQLLGTAAVEDRPSAAA